MSLYATITDLITKKTKSDYSVELLSHTDTTKIILQVFREFG